MPPAEPELGRRGGDGRLRCDDLEDGHPVLRHGRDCHRMSRLMCALSGVAYVLNSDTSGRAIAPRLPHPSRPLVLEPSDLPDLVPQSVHGRLTGIKRVVCTRGVAIAQLGERLRGTHWGQHPEARDPRSAGPRTPYPQQCFAGASSERPSCTPRPTYPRQAAESGVSGASAAWEERELDLGKRVDLLGATLLLPGGLRQ